LAYAVPNPNAIVKSKAVKKYFIISP